MKTIRIGEGKYAIVITDKDGILENSDLIGISDTLREWWEGNEKFVIIAEWGNLNIRFEKLKENNES